MLMLLFLNACNLLLFAGSRWVVPALLGQVWRCFMLPHMEVALNGIASVVIWLLFFHWRLKRLLHRIGSVSGPVFDIWLPPCYSRSSPGNCFTSTLPSVVLMSFLSNYEGQDCGAKSKDRPTYSSPPALSSCFVIPLVSSGSVLWSEPSSLNKFSSCFIGAKAQQPVPPSSSSWLNCSRSPAEWVHPPWGGVVSVCVIFVFCQYPMPVNTGKGLWKRLSRKLKVLSRSSLLCPQLCSISATINTIEGQPLS